MLPMCDQTQCYSMDGKIVISKLTMKAPVEEKSAYETPYGECGSINSMGHLECTLIFLTGSPHHRACNRPTCKDPGTFRGQDAQACQHIQTCLSEPQRRSSYAKITSGHSLLKTASLRETFICLRKLWQLKIVILGFEETLESGCSVNSASRIRLPGH